MEINEKDTDRFDIENKDVNVSDVEETVLPEQLEDAEDIIEIITADEEEIEDREISLADTLIEADKDDLNEVIESAYAIDIAITMEEFDDEELLAFYHRLDDEHMAQILEQMDEDLQQRFVALLDYKSLLSIFGYMSNDDIADVLGEMPINRRKDLLRLFKDKDNEELQSLLLYPEDTAGGIMTTEYIAVPSHYTIKNTLDLMKEIGPKTEVIDTIYVLNTSLKELIGVIGLRDILSASDDTVVSEIMELNVISVTPEMDQEEVSQIVAKYDLKAVPVINRKGALLGIITVDDIIDVLIEEQTEDMLRLGGTGSEDLDEPVFDSVKKRLPWLIVLLGLGIVVGTVVGRFEDIVAALPIVICFQSLILDMAGNVGTQSLAVTIRTLTDDDMSLKDSLSLVSKESRVGLMNGLILAVVALFGIGAYVYVAKVHDITFAFSISACIGASLIVAMLVSSIMGTCIPMFFKKVGVDPAVASGPLITTINDLVAVVAYYGLAKILLINMLHLTY